MGNFSHCMEVNDRLRGDATYSYPYGTEQAGCCEEVPESGPHRFRGAWDYTDKRVPRIAVIAIAALSYCFSGIAQQGR